MNRAGQQVPGAALPESVGRRIKMPIYFEPDLFEAVRRRAEREGSCFGDVVCAIVARAMGG